MQVLKEEVRSRILCAAEKVFYEKDFRSAKLQDIAAEAEVPVALIYTYFKNKAVLFDAIVEPLYESFFSAMEEEEKIDAPPSERFERAGKKYIHGFLREHKRIVILMDKSSGTKHAEAKQKMIEGLQSHIERGLKKYSSVKSAPMLSHILASNYTEGLLEIARHYQGQEWAEQMLALMDKCYYHGVESL